MSGLICLSLCQSVSLCFCLAVFDITCTLFQNLNTLLLLKYFFHLVKVVKSIFGYNSQISYSLFYKIHHTLSFMKMYLIFYLAKAAQ